MHDPGLSLKELLKFVVNLMPNGSAVEFYKTLQGNVNFP